MKIFIAVAVAAVLSGSTYFAYDKYEQSKLAAKEDQEQRELISAISVHVKHASLRVENASRYETDADSKLTFKDIFEKLEADIGEIDKRLIEIQMLASTKNASVSQPATEYLRASEAFLRALLRKQRSVFTHGVAKSSAVKAATTFWQTVTRYGYDSAMIQSDTNAANRAFGEAKEELKAAAPDLRIATEKLKVARSALVSVLPADVLPPTVQLDAIIAKLSENNAMNSISKSQK